MKQHSSSPDSIRWWPAVLILIMAAAAWFWISWSGFASRQEKYISAAKVFLPAFILLLIWFAGFSRVRRRARWAVLGSALFGVLLGSILFEIKGVTGDLLPIFGWRWKSAPADLETGGSLALSTTATNLTTGFAYPQFLGPARNATLEEPLLARDWTAQPPELLWRRPIGAAWSGFAIAGGRAVTQEQRGPQEIVSCYDFFTGNALWSHADEARYFTTIAGEGPRGTPTIASNRVVTLGGTGILNCLDLETGAPLWTRNIAEDHQCSPPDWGFSGSPLVAGAKVIVHPGGAAGSSLAAYDLASGELVWKGGDAGAGYSSPMLASLEEQEQVLIFNARSIASHDLNLGSVLWEYRWPGGHPHVAMPVLLSDNRVLVSSGYGTGSEMLQIRKTEGEWAARRLWKSIRLKAKFTNVVQQEGYIYGLDDGIMVCLDAATGDLQWKEGRYGHGQVILVGDLLLVMAESGEVILLDPKPDAHEEISKFKALNGKTWNPPALAGPYLVIRNHLEAACYQLPLRKD